MTDAATQIEAIGSNFRTAMRGYPATVNIITSRHNEVDHGMTATAVTSVTMDPPSMLVCLNKQTYLHEMLLCQPVFAVNVLAQRQHELSDAFSGKLSPQERFSLGQWQRHSAGVLTLSDAHARVVCRRAAAIPYGTHTIFIGEVIDVAMADASRPLLYEDARYCGSHPA
ncbi:flavin reductase family protein [Pusillimonas sp.]|uniref:flavin reductase family protein n=1 Tax=Pusillimonas sp. TaxID=3040095 RepID=UPI0029B41343|nr:flavin reductase family protein [Pusillimonas sp.]MDX3895062.1 flavin reductase family protein [Pusillimonas sp.]